MLEGLRRTAALTRGLPRQGAGRLGALPAPLGGRRGRCLPAGPGGPRRAEYDARLRHEVAGRSALLSVQPRLRALAGPRGLPAARPAEDLRRRRALPRPPQSAARGRTSSIRLRALAAGRRCFSSCSARGPPGHARWRDYRAQVRELQRQVAAAKSPAEVDPRLWERLHGRRSDVETGGAAPESTTAGWRRAWAATPGAPAREAGRSC